MKQIPVLLLGTIEKSWYPSLVAATPTGGSAQVAAGGGVATAGNVHVIRSTEKEDGRLGKVVTP